MISERRSLTVASCLAGLIAATSAVGDADGAPRTSAEPPQRAAVTTEMVSVNSHGVQGDFDSGNGFYRAYAVSADGRFVAFLSWADNLVTHDTTPNGDVFVRDLESGTTSKVSVSSAGVESHALSG